MERILVVGASSGIGYSIVEHLLNQDVQILAAARHINSLETLHKENLSCFKLDATNENELVEFSIKLGKIDHLICTLRGKSITDNFINSNTKEVQTAFYEKFWTQYNLARYLLSNINANGSIILTSGIASQRSYKNYYWMAAANGAIESLVKSLSVDIAPIRINAVSPGFVENKENDTEKLNIIKKIEPKLPMSRLASKNEVVEAYLYLLHSTYTTGNILTIDGGVLCA